MNYITIERAANQCGISHSAMGIAVKRRGMNTMLSRGKKNNKLILVSKDDVDNFAKLRSTYGHVPHGFITVFSAANLFGCGDSTIKTLVKRHLVNSVISLNHRGVETLFVDREGIKKAIKDAETSEEYMDRFEVAELFDVHPREVQHWAFKNKINSFTHPRIGPGDAQHRLYLRSEMESLHKQLTSSPDISDTFGYYLAGLTDGEGSFTINTRDRNTANSNEAHYKLTLRDDDAEIIITIREVLGFGTIRFRKSSSPNSNPSFSYEIARHMDAIKLIAIFDKFPLRAKKARDYAIWRAFVIERSRPIPDQRRLDKLARDIVAIRKYKSPKKELIEKINRLNQDTRFHVRSYGFTKHA